MPNTDDDDTNTYTPDGLTYSPPDYGTNLYLAQFQLTNGFMTGIASNTLADVEYSLLTNVDLTTTNWVPLTPVLFGSELTNWTALGWLPFNPTNNLFFRLRSEASSDGSGLPDWWEQLYFGTNGVDPYGNPAGDGWNNLQKYQNGWNPNQFYPPAAPQGLTVTYNNGTGSAALNWQPSPGAVTGYTILRQDSPTSSFSAITTVSASQTSYTDNSYPGGNGVEYEIEADYDEGISPPSDGENPRITPHYTVPAYIVRGPSGLPYLTVAGIPEKVTAFRIYRVDSQAAFYPISSYVYPDPDYGYTNSIYTWDETQLFSSGSGNGYFDIPVTNLVNGVYQLTTSQAPLYRTFAFQIQALSADGMAGEIVTNGYATGDSGRADYNIPFYDGRTQIAQNINFLLRTAQTNTPFSISTVFGSEPYSYSGHTDYVYAGFHFCNNNNGSPLVLNEFQPFEENNYYKNFCYASGNVDSSGKLNTGVTSPDGYYGSDGVHWDYNTFTYTPPTTYYFDTYGFVTGSSPSMSAVLSSTTAQWIYFGYGSYAISLSFNTNYFVPSVNNIYGLSLASIKWPGPNTPPTFPTLSPGNAGANVSGDWFFQYNQPALSSNGYYFARHYIDPLPGESDFSITNTTPPVIFTSVGQPFAITAWTKQSLQNGYSGKFAYAEQYFDKAYLADTNGNITTNQTGILSEYGEFFPTQPGTVILTTKADGALGTVGQCKVNVIGMNVDANHDGTMDLSFNGTDATSANSPMECWVNNGYILPGVNGGLDQDFPLPQDNPNSADYAVGKITCARDLENFFRLWICGVPALAFSNGYSATLTCSTISGSPAINVYLAETNGGIGYLTDTNVAQGLVGETLLGTVGAPTADSPGTLVFPNGFFDGSNKYLLFEGAGIGAGQFNLTIYQGTNAIAQTSTYIDLHDVKDFYERAVITENTSGMISNWSSSIETVQQASSSALGGDTNLIVFVHGFNVGGWDWINDSDTVFKRLYWAGYHGKFMTVRWPCGKVSLDPYSFNTSEVNAYKASASMKTYLSELRSRFPDHRLNILAHSQGNAVVGEAIEQGAPFDTYIISQGAIPASCFDANATVDTEIASYDWGDNITPEWQPMGYHGVYTNLTGRIVNFYNEVDYALATGTASGNYFPVNWKRNQELLKPTLFYSYDGTQSSYVSLFLDYIVTDPQESRANVSRSRTDAVGATAGLGGVINSSIDLQAQFQFGRALEEHSAQWTRPIQTSRPYYIQVINSMSP